MRWQIYGVWASMVVSLVGLGFIVWTVEPQVASPQVKALFFIVLFILVWSTATLVIFSIKNRLVRSRALSESASDLIFYDSFLTGLFISVIFVAAILIRRLVNF